MGLPEILEDLIILTYAEQTNRIFKLHSGPANADLGTLENDMTLEEVSLPSESDWQKAGEMVKAIFGIPASPLLNATNVTIVGEGVREKVRSLVQPVHSLIGRIEALQTGRFGEGDCSRLETAREGLSLLKALETTAGNGLISKLAGFQMRAKPAALGVALSSASKLEQALEVADWEIFDGIALLTDERKEAADEVWNDLREAFNTDEYAVALLPKLTELRQRAVKLLTKAATPVVPAPTQAPTQPSMVILHTEPSCKTASALKELYGRSQVEGDDVPEWLSKEAQMTLLRVHCFGHDANDWKSLVVVTPMLEALIRLDEKAVIDLAGETLKLPRFGKNLSLQVKPEHLDS